MEAERHPASSETDTLHNLATLIAIYLREGDEDSPPYPLCLGGEAEIPNAMKGGGSSESPGLLT